MAVDLDVFKELGQGRLPGLIGIEVEEIEQGHVRMRLPLRDDVLRRWQQKLVAEVQPLLDELDALHAPIPTTKTKKEVVEAAREQLVIGQM